jgi:uroporphyrinogen decarboxylase
MGKTLLNILQNKPTSCVPFWFMRQAGRYLPEYRALRATTGGFMDLCFTPEKAAEVTLQPIRRFHMDGAILFSDILVIPHAMGVSVHFEAGEGPVVETTTTQQRIEQLSVVAVEEKLLPIMQTIQIVKNQLPPDVTFIGFAGAPWTVACYMLQGRGGKDFTIAREFSYAQPALLKQLLQKITDATILYLRAQCNAGVEVLQLFDSWASLVPPAFFHELVTLPNAAIVAALKQSHPHIPIIGFAKHIPLFLADYADHTRVDAVGIDMHTPMDFARSQLPGKILQGNMDPLLLAGNKITMLQEAAHIKKTMQGQPFIFNLGHGMVPHTPIENVEALVQFLKETA